MITKVLVAAAFAGLAAVGVAAPASADPASFGDISCSCEAPGPQGQVPLVSLPPEALVDQGIRQGMSDTGAGAVQP